MHAQERLTAAAAAARQQIVDLVAVDLEEAEADEHRPGAAAGCERRAGRLQHRRRRPRVDPAHRVGLAGARLPEGKDRQLRADRGCGGPARDGLRPEGRRLLGAMINGAGVRRPGRRWCCHAIPQQLLDPVRAFPSSNSR
jgi:hypothetical protein